MNPILQKQINIAFGREYLDDHLSEVERASLVLQFINEHPDEVLPEGDINAQYLWIIENFSD